MAIVCLSKSIGVFGGTKAYKQHHKYTTSVCLCLSFVKAEMYAAGEELFALKSTQHPELTKIKKEACLLDQLYGLYMDVIHTLERCGLPRIVTPTWAEVLSLYGENSECPLKAASVVVIRN